MNPQSSMPVLLLALLAANRFKDSPGDSGRVALLAMAIKPPMMGLLIALLVAKQKGHKIAVAKNSGVNVIDEIVPKEGHREFPDFLNLTQNEADELAKKSGLTPEFHTVGQEHKIERVIKQEPKAKSRWTKDIKGVQLYLG